jgi:hypothetical protein
MIKKSSVSISKVPDYLSYFAFKKDQDSKKLAKDIIKGEYNNIAEE